MVEQMEHSIWFVPVVVVGVLFLYQLVGPILFYKYEIKRDRLEIWSLSVFRVASIRFSDIEIIRVATLLDLAPWNFAARYVTRPLSHYIYIKRRRGFPKRILITPAEPQKFISIIGSHT